MKRNIFSLFFALLLAGFITQGFQCGSPDFTGAKVQEQNKNYREAAKLYEKEVQKNPANFEAWYRLGRLRGMELNDFAGMTQAFRESEKLSPTFSSDIHALRGHFWVQFINSGVYNKNRATSNDSIETALLAGLTESEVISLFGEATSKVEAVYENTKVIQWTYDNDKHEANLYFFEGKLKGWVRKTERFYDNAIADYKTANMVWPDTSITFLYLAGAYKAKGDLDSTIICLTKVWEMDHDVDSYKSVGRIYVQIGLEKKDQFRTANADKLKIQKNLQDVDKGSYKNDITLAFGNPDSQKKDKKNPKKEDWVYNQYGMTFTLESDRVVNRIIDKPIDLKIDSTLYAAAVVEFNKAVDVFEAIKKIDPKDNENLNLLLQAYYEADRTVEATKAFKLAVENDPGNKMNHYILGLLYRTVNDYDGAINEFNTAIKLDSTFTDAFYDIGATYYNWGVRMKKSTQEKGDESEEYKTKFQAALPWMQKMSEIKKDDPRIWETLGTIYALLGQAENATKALDEADKIRKAGK